jgi:hypothetical protein
VTAAAIVTVRAVVNPAARAVKMAVATGVAATKPVAKVVVVVVDAVDAVTDQPKANVSVLMPRASLCPLMWM